MAEDSFDYDLEGLDALEITLKEVTKETKFKGGRAALRKAANLVRDAAIQNALKIDDPETAEQIAKNIVVRWSSRRFKRTGDLAFRVGVLGGARSTGKTRRATIRQRARSGQASLESLGEIAGRGKQNPGGDTFHWRFIEFGTSRSRAQPFMRKALAENVGQTTDEFIRQYDKALQRAIKRAKNKVPVSRARKRRK